jgi:hypothetical protein
MPTEIEGITYLTQEEVNQLVGNARVKARTQAQAEFDEAKAKATADAQRKALKEKEQWEQLATTTESRVRELEPLEAKVKAYDELIAGILKDRVAALGERAKTAVDALPDGMDDLAKLEWLNKNVTLFQGGDDVGTPRHQRNQVLQPGQKGPACKYPVKL